MSNFQKEEEEAELTKAYEQFREAFEDGTSIASKSFVRAAVVNASRVVEGKYTIIYAFL